MRHSFKSTLICIALLGGVFYESRAIAADLPGNKSFYTPMFSANWGGLYGGLHLGYASGRSRSADIDGFVSGVHLGFNTQGGSVVLGGELDLNYSGADYRSFADTFRQKWGGSARARVGYAFERFLPFVTGGVAFTSGTMKAGGAKETNVHIGYVVGIGGEMMITNNISANLQLLHFRYGAETYNVLPAARSANIVVNELRIGMNYRF